jgi:hypothetical protein
MSCHVRAAHGDGANYDTIANRGFLGFDDAYFKELTRTDFLWSIPGNALP